MRNNGKSRGCSGERKEDGKACSTRVFLIAFVSRCALCTSFSFAIGDPDLLLSSTILFHFPRRNWISDAWPLPRQSIFISANVPSKSRWWSWTSSHGWNSVVVQSFLSFSPVLLFPKFPKKYRASKRVKLCTKVDVDNILFSEKRNLCFAIW